jgi:hypothetical protein
VLGATRATPPTFAVNPKGPPENAVASRRRQPHRGTTFRYAISESARVVFTIELTAKGRRVGNRCVKPTPANRRKRACTRYTLVGRFARSAVTGANTKSFSGRIGRKRLSPGSYRATLVATDAAGNRSKPRYVLFRVVRG